MTVENKTYYGREYNNRYRGSSEGRYDRDNFMAKKRSHTILPPPSILQAYEEIAEGSAKVIVDMATIEQEHRHEWEKECLRVYTRSHRLGQLSGLLIAVAIIYASIYLSDQGDYNTATAIAASGFLSLIVSSIIAFKTRKMERKPRKIVINRGARSFAPEEEEEKEE